MLQRQPAIQLKKAIGLHLTEWGPALSGELPMIEAAEEGSDFVEFMKIVWINSAKWAFVLTLIHRLTLPKRFPLALKVSDCSVSNTCSMEQVLKETAL